MLCTLNNTFCCSRSFSMGSTDEKLISLDTALHFKIFFGTLASCSLSGNDLLKIHEEGAIKNVHKILNLFSYNSYRSSLPCHNTTPVSASLRFIQLLVGGEQNKNFNKIRPGVSIGSSFDRNAE